MQHGVVAGLDRQVDVFAHLGQVGHRLDDAAAHIRRVRGKEADAFQAVNIIEADEQVGQILPVVPVVAIGVHRLPQHRNLADAPAGQQFHLAGDVVHRTADLPSPAIGDDAEAAHQVAAVDDGDIGSHLGPSGRQRADAALPVQPQPFADQLQQRLKLLRAQEQVDIGEAAGQLVSAGADHAAGEGQNGVGPLFTQGLHQVEVAGDLVLGGLADDAGIEHHHIGVGGTGRGSKAQLLQRRPQSLGVGGVHLAADGPDVISLHDGRFRCAPGIRLPLPAPLLMPGAGANGPMTAGYKMAEGVGFEPTIPVSQDKRLAGARTRPLCDPSPRTRLVE